MDNYYFFNPPENFSTDSELRAENARVWERAGFKSIYSRLLEVGCFNGLASTPLRSVRKANFVEALRILSLKNTGV